MIGSTLVVGGDGRYGVVEATDKIIKMAAANKVFLKTSVVTIRHLHTEGGTGENWRIDPHLFGNLTLIIFGKNWFRSSPRLKIFSDPHLDKIRSALTAFT